MDFAAARVKMVDNQIRTTDVTDLEILRAFLNVPRELFVPAERRELAYIGAEMPLGSGRTMMEASPLAKLLQLVEVRLGDKALDVAGGTGYAAAILSRLGAQVTMLESDETLAETARVALAQAGASAEVVTGPLNEGHSAAAPYDVILIEGAVDTVPQALMDQLADRGRLVTVVGYGNAGMARLFVKDGDIVSDRFGFNCSLRPLPGFQKSPSFVF
ncbi:protein-L-isoaspartate O-methyltransferase family protein [Aureimonas mangrovi]|uniref:protein-L-isoaspartate O-methyltransferase family protein n=1 Tax=Aureimonas mangrovi TaxID=2758041 RepID=UPI00163DD408|nr:protein-L-isoaspartate O-methyltransferase [Aureimonas mangrovi]